ncbi:MAG TPA: hypothetical protein VM869_18865 [Enhygromyxa sp.]|nr:hypothetical protein [Enhygromyxa sp.]
MAADRTGGPNKPLPPPFAGIPKDDERRTAAAAEYQKQLAELDPEAIELDDAPTPVAPITLPSYPSAEPGRPTRPNLEPIPEQAHPAGNRRIPTQPPISLEVDASDDGSAPSSGQLGYVPPPPIKSVPRQSPAPVRRGLFSIDRPTNLLAGAAVGLLLTVFPAKKLAESYETRTVEPMLAELEKSVEQTLAVDAGLVESPESVAARIHDGRKHVRRRFLLVWLLVGLPIGVGLGLAPRPGD